MSVGEIPPPVGFADFPPGASPEPAFPRQGSPASSSGPGRSDPKFRPLRILIAEDDPDAAASLRDFLEMLGHRVRTVGDGDAAVAAADSGHPDLILMDIGLPRMSGLAAAEKIRRRPWGRDVVLVAVTGWREESDRRRSRESGFDRHLLKPLRLETLKLLLESVAGDH